MLNAILHKKNNKYSENADFDFCNFKKVCL